MSSQPGSGEVCLPGCRFTVYGTISMVRKGLESSLVFPCLKGADPIHEYSALKDLAS